MEGGELILFSIDIWNEPGQVALSCNPDTERQGLWINGGDGSGNSVLPGCLSVGLPGHFLMALECPD